MMLRIQVLKYLYNLSDEQLIQVLSVNLAYKWFVGLTPKSPCRNQSNLEDLIEKASQASFKEVIPAVEQAQEILTSDLFIQQKGIRSLVDQNARVGYKSKTQSFYGYKAELCQTTDGSLKLA